jgi:uncharacterized protein (TIGR00369 family)
VADPFDGAALMRQFVPSSPFAALLGLRVVETDDGRAVLELPWRPELATMGATAHGGAIATLLDTAAMVAAWCGAPEPTSLRGSTASLSISYLAPAEAADLRATAQVLRRGRSLTHVEVEVTADGGRVAKGLVAYRVG